MRVCACAVGTRGRLRGISRRRRRSLAEWGRDGGGVRGKRAGEWLVTLHAPTVISAADRARPSTHAVNLFSRRAHRPAWLARPGRERGRWMDEASVRPSCGCLITARRRRHSAEICHWTTMHLPLTADRRRHPAVQSCSVHSLSTRFSDRLANRHCPLPTYDRLPQLSFVHAA